MKKYKNSTNDNQVPNIIAQGTIIVGDIISEGDFRIEGSIKGTIKAKGRVVVGKSGTVDGEITCSDIDVCGIVKGKIEVINHTVLNATANYSGDLITKKISIEPGAIFSGTCQMATKMSENENKKVEK